MADDECEWDVCMAEDDDEEGVGMICDDEEDEDEGPAVGFWLAFVAEALEPEAGAEAIGGLWTSSLSAREMLKMCAGEPTESSRCGMVHKLLYQRPLDQITIFSLIRRIRFACETAIDR